MRTNGAEQGGSMARAGSCEECGGTVWLNDDGSCVNGHPPGSVTDSYETGQPRPPAVPAPPQPVKKSTGLIVAIVAAVLIPFLLLLVGILAAIAIPAFSGAQASAKSKSCFAYERTVEGATQEYLVSDSNNRPPADWAGAMSVLVPT